MATNDPIAITVRYTAGAYIARFYGERQSVLVCESSGRGGARKIMGNRPHALIRVGR
jgi:hypothetical protein